MVDQGVLEMVFNHIDRLRIFNLYGSASTWELVCSLFLQMPAPNHLECLQLLGSTSGHLTCLIITRPTCGALGLDWCTIDLTSPVLTPLTSLYVNLSEENCPSHLFGLVKYSWKNAVPPIDTSLTVQFQVDRPTIFFHSSISICWTSCWLYMGHFTSVKHLIMPPCCGLDLRCDHAHLGFDQRQLWTIIKKKEDRLMCEKCSISSS